MTGSVSKTGSSRFNFVAGIIAELKKVTWLSRREAIYLTTLVLIVTIAVGIVLGAIDFGFSFIIEKLFIGG